MSAPTTGILRFSSAFECPMLPNLARAKLESLWPGEFRARSPLPDGRVDFGVVLSGYTNSGFAIIDAVNLFRFNLLFELPRQTRPTFQTAQPKIMTGSGQVFRFNHAIFLVAPKSNSRTRESSIGRPNK